MPVRSCLTLETRPYPSFGPDLRDGSRVRGRSPAAGRQTSHFLEELMAVSHAPHDARRAGTQPDGSHGTRSPAPAGDQRRVPLIVWVTGTAKRLPEAAFGSCAVGALDPFARSPGATTGVLAQLEQSTATARASHTWRIRASLNRPSRSSSTASDTLSTESRLTAERRGTGSSPGSSTTSLTSSRIVVVHGAIRARRCRGITASRESKTTGRRPISGISHHQTSPRAGKALTTRPPPA